MKLKNFLSLVLVALLCFAPATQSVAAAAEPFSIVSPLYEIAGDAQSALNISGSTASCRSIITFSAAVKITAEQYLQKQGFLWIWTTYDGAEWEETVYDSTIAMFNSKSGLTKGKYRLKTIFTLTDKNGKSEKITVYSVERSVS